MLAMFVGIVMCAQVLGGFHTRSMVGIEVHVHVHVRVFVCRSNEHQVFTAYFSAFATGACKPHTVSKCHYGYLTQTMHSY